MICAVSKFIQNKRRKKLGKKERREGRKEEEESFMFKRKIREHSRNTEGFE